MERHLPPSSSAIVKAALGYPALLVAFFRLQSSNDTSRLARAFKAVSTVHSLLCATLALRDMLHPKWEARNLIFHRDEDANALIGLELGYMLQDSLALIVAKRIYKYRVPKRTVLHHAVYIPLLAAFFEYASRSAEYGVFFVEAFLVMNASTPLINLKWFLRNSTGKNLPQKQLLVRLLDVLLLGTYASSRIGLLFYMLGLYGKRKGISILQAYKSIPLQCRFGTLAIGVVNSYWLLELLSRIVYNNRRNHPI